jgi:hypothetical protein
MNFLPTKARGETFIWFMGELVKKTRFVVGYHGTTNSNADKIRRTSFRESRRAGLWLGFGRYFFQDAPIHALKWARYRARKETGDSENAAVLCAEIDLAECIDLTDRSYWPQIRSIFENEVRDTGTSQLGIDTLLNRLSMTEEERAELTDEEKIQLGMHYVDCEVMNIFIQRLKDKMRPKGFDYSTVRAAFIEGDPVYLNSWLWDRSAVVISILEPRAFLGPIEQISEAELLELKSFAQEMM